MLFAVLLVATLSLTCIASASAADIGTAQTQTDNNSTVQEKVNTQFNCTNSTNKSATTQNSVDKCVKTLEKTDNTTTSTSTNQTSDKQTQRVSNDTTTKTVTPTSSINQKTENTTQKEEAAAGETKTVSTTTVTSTSFTVSQIEDAAARVKAYVETNKKLPNYVTIGTTQVKMPDFLKLLTTSLLQLNTKTTTPVTLKTVNAPVKPTESITSGNIYKANYIDLAKRVNAYIDANGVVPNYASSNLGKLRYESLIYTFSKILNYYKTNNALPNYVTVKPWSTISSTTSASTPVPAELQQYLKATSNCQVNDSSIKALAASITSGKTSTYDKAVAIFNWVRDKIGYSFYYNTQKGAVGTLNAKTANCCDTSHLLIALERAAGIPARYVHADAKFTSGNTYGHVWAEVYVNGKWYTADATSSKNSFGVVKNWNSATIKGRYASLPF